MDTAPIDREVYRATERDEVLQLREAKRRSLRDSIETTRQELKALAEAHRTEVEDPLQIAVREVEGHRVGLVDATRGLGADTEIPSGVHYPIDAEAIGRRIKGLREVMSEVLDLAESRKREAGVATDDALREAAFIAGELAMCDQSLDVAAIAADASCAEARTLDGLVQATRTTAELARYRAHRAANDQKAFADIVDSVVQLQEMVGEVTALERALTDLNASLKPGAFLKWLTLRRSRDLLVHASGMLMEMTGGRYSFADPGDREDQWLVLDNDSGQARSPASLSGGEQFIGSLALALGMVEMMARAGGRLESLFLDEGFGSLDRSNLDAAIEALATAAKRGRMVGVISPVGAVAEQIDDVLVVTREPTGSQAKWLSRAQRRDPCPLRGAGRWGLGARGAARLGRVDLAQHLPLPPRPHRVAEVARRFDHQVATRAERCREDRFHVTQDTPDPPGRTVAHDRQPARFGRACCHNPLRPCQRDRLQRFPPARFDGES